MQSLLSQLESFHKVAEELKQRLIQVVTDEMYKKGNFLLKEGQVDRYIWYIEKGLVVNYKDTESGLKVTHILEGGDFVIAPDSFASGCPTNLNILALEDTLTWRTTQSDLMDTCEELPVFYKHYTTIEGLYRKLELKFNALTPKEKFDDLWNKRPTLFNRVKKEFLASYLDMSVSTFDNLRKG